MQFVKGAEEPTGPDIENNTSLGSVPPGVVVAPGAVKQTNSPGSLDSGAKFEKISEVEMVD